MPDLAGQGEHQWLPRAIVYAGVAGILAIVVYALQAKDVTQGASVFGVALMVAGACVLVGGLFGFIFGIPRSPQPSPPRPTNATNDAATAGDESSVVVYQPNTNLEQLSDWLAKILVGVGLTQISTVPQHLSAISRELGPGLGGFGNSQTFALGIVIYFTLAGFILSYLMTRMYLGPALRQAEIQYTSQLIIDKMSKQAEDDFSAILEVGQALGQLTGLASPATSYDQATWNQLIARASGATKALILRDTAEFRSRTWDKPEETALTIPIFRALVRSGITHHSLYANLGAALKDSQAHRANPQYDEAIRWLGQAIASRGDYREKDHVWYEYIRAGCYILKQNASRRPPSVEDKQKVLVDLDAALESTDLRAYLQGAALETIELSARARDAAPQLHQDDRPMIRDWLKKHRDLEQELPEDRQDQRVVARWLQDNPIDLEPPPSTESQPLALRAG